MDVAMANPGRLNAQQHLFTFGLRIWVLPRFQRLSAFDDVHGPHDRILRLKRRVVPLDETAEFAWITRLAKETGRPVWFLLTDRPTDPERWRRIMAGVHQARAAGASVTAQVAGRPVGVILGIATSLNPFAVRERYKSFEALPLSERFCCLRDPAARLALLYYRT